MLFWVLLPGFESFQIRELELILGLTQEQRSREMDPVKHFKVRLFQVLALVLVLMLALALALALAFI